jgi:hypothetical protein
VFAGRCVHHEDQVVLDAVLRNVGHERDRLPDVIGLIQA